MRKTTFCFIISLWLLLGTHCRREEESFLPATTPRADPFPSATMTGTATRPAVTLPAQTPASFIVEELPTPTPTASPTPVLYHIRPGDTLLGIALANGIELEELLALNTGIDPNLLQIGQAIALPVVTDSPQAEAGLSAAIADLEIINAAFYEDRSGGFWVLGEVVNRSSQDKTGIVIELLLYDEGGNEEATLQIRPVVDVLPSDGKIPFGRLISEVDARPSAWQATVVQATVFEDTEAIYRRLSPEIAEVTITGRLVKVDGQMANTDDLDAESISIIATAYTEDGKIAGFRHQSIAEPLAAGAVLAISIEILCAVEPTGEISVLAVARSTGEP